MKTAQYTSLCEKYIKFKNYRICDLILNTSKQHKWYGDYILEYNPNTLLSFYIENFFDLKDNYYYQKDIFGSDLSGDNLKLVCSRVLKAIEEVYPDCNFFHRLPVIIPEFTKKIDGDHAKKTWILEEEEASLTAINVRIGDVLDCCKNHTAYDHFSRYIPTRLCVNEIETLNIGFSSVENSLACILNDDIYAVPIQHYLAHDIPSDITLVAGGNIAVENSLSKSIEYLNLIKNFFESREHNVRVRLGHDPDRDLIFMLQAKNYIPCGGKFSNFISTLRKYLWHDV